LQKNYNKIPPIATAKRILDTKKVKKGTFPIKLKISHILANLSIPKIYYNNGRIKKNMQPPTTNVKY